MKRKIISIDEDRCNGCGNCVTGCEEGALQIIDGKAKLVNEQFCDGFGDCIGVCPTGALKIEERESEEFNIEATLEHVKNLRGREAAENVLAAQRAHNETNRGGCPGSQLKDLQNSGNKENTEPPLNQWPIQINLLPPEAPFYNNTDLLVTADCVPPAYGDFRKLLGDKIMALGCPKLDNAGRYIDKLTSIFAGNDINSVTVVRMEVPCCGGLVSIVKRALDQAGSELDLKIIVITTEGKIKNTTER